MGADAQYPGAEPAVGEVEHGVEDECLLDIRFRDFPPHDVGTGCEEHPDGRQVSGARIVVQDAIVFRSQTSWHGRRTGQKKR